MADTRVGGAYVELTLDDQKFLRSIKKSETEISRFSARLDTIGAVAKKAGTALTLGLTAPLVAIGVASVSAFEKQEKALASLENAIKATGREGEISAEGIAQFAGELQKVTTFGDEATIQAAALVQQFANLDEEGLREVLPRIQNLSAALGLDLQSAASLVGKTLGSSTNALSRYGIELDATADPTEKLVQLTEALDEKFAGSAETLANTAGGQLQQAKNAIGDVSEEIGAVLLPVIADLANAVVPIVQRFAELDDQAKKNAVAIAALAASIGPLLLGLSSTITAVKTLRTALIALQSANPAILAVVAAVAAVTAGVVALERRQARLKEESLSVWQDLAEQVRETADEVESFKESAAGVENFLNKAQIDDLQRYDELLDKVAEKYSVSREEIILIAEASETVTQETRNQLETLREQAQERAALIALSTTDELQQERILLRQLDAADAARERLAAVQAQEAITQSQADLEERIATNRAQAVRIDQLAAQGRITEEEQFTRKLALRNDELELLKEQFIENGSLSSQEQQRYDFLLSKIAIYEESLNNVAAGQEEASIGFFARLAQASQKTNEEILKTQEVAEKAYSDIEKAWRETGERAFTSGIAFIGTFSESLANQSDSWEDLGKAAIGTIAAILEGLGAQLAALAAVNFAEAIFSGGATLAPGGVALAGSAAAFAAAGVLRAKANEFADGGIVPGSSFSGDRVPALVNSGEMILNRDQQAQLFDLANGGQTVNNQVGVNVMAEVDQGVLFQVVQSGIDAGQIRITQGDIV
jgi:TP901 family phage tail tape measure protein